MQMVDVLEKHLGWLFEDGGEEWPVADYLEEWRNGAADGDRGPEVVCRELVDGRISVRRRVGRGELGELLGFLAPSRR